MKKKSVKINAILNVVKSIMSIIFPMITFPYVSRKLGVESYGIYQFSSSIISYFTLIAGLGVSTYAIREGSCIRDDKSKIEAFISEVFTINIFSMFFSLILLGVLMMTVEKLVFYRIALLILSIEIIFTTLGTQWICNIFEDFAYITIRYIMMNVLSFVLTILLIKSPQDIYIYISIVVIANAGANLLNFFYVRKNYCNIRIDITGNLKRHLKPIIIIFSTSVAITIYVSSDSTMLGFMCSNYEVGLYGAAVKIYTIMKNILASVLVVLIPRFSIIIASNNSDEINSAFSKVFNVLVVLIMPASVGLFIKCHSIILAFSGNEYEPATTALKLLSVAVIFSLIGYMYINCILIPSHRENIVFVATLVSAILNVVLNIFLIPIWGINATAFTTIVAEGITFVLAIIASKDLVRLINIKNNISSVSIGCIGIIGVCSLADYLIKDLIPNLIISVTSGVIVYFFILLILNNSVLSEYGNVFWRKISRINR